MSFGPISVVGAMGRRKGGGGIVESGGCGEHTNMCKHINDQRSTMSRTPVCVHTRPNGLCTMEGDI